MSSKYADLPDIDTAPDVYETEDVPPERIQYAEDSDDDLINPTSSRAIQKAKDDQGREYPDESPLPDFNLAGAKFGALAAKTYSLYPTPVQTRRNPTLVGPSLSSDLERSALLPIDDEPPRARLRRLRYEMDELEGQLAAESSDLSSEDKKENEVKDMLRELKGLMSGLNKLDVDGAKLAVDQSGRSWEDRMRELRRNLEDAQALSDATPGLKEDKLSTETNQSTSQEVKERKIGEIDKRLVELESAIGVGRTGLDDSQTLPTPLLPTVQKLDHLLTLLTQPRHLDAISRRIKLLLTDLDRAQATTSTTANTNLSTTGPASSSDPNNRRAINHLYHSDSSSPSSSTSLTVAQVQKIDSLASMLPKIQPILPILPPLLDRLHSLSDLHSASSSFGSTLDRLETEASRLRESSIDLKTIVDQMEGSLKENESRVEGNLRAIGERVEDVLRRVEALER